MANQSFLTTCLVFYLAFSVTGALSEDGAPKMQSDVEIKELPMRDPPTTQGSSQAGTEKSATSDGKQKVDDVSAFQQTLRRLASVLPAGSLQHLQMIPLVNTSPAIPANLLKIAAAVSPSEGLHQTRSLTQRAEAAAFDNFLTPMSNFFGASVNKSRILMPAVRIPFRHSMSLHPVTLKEVLLLAQIDKLRQDILTGLRILKSTLVNQTADLGLHGSAETSPKATPLAVFKPVQILPGDAIPEFSTSEVISQESKPKVVAHTVFKPLKMQIFRGSAIPELSTSEVTSQERDPKATPQSFSSKRDQISQGNANFEFLRSENISQENSAPGKVKSDSSSPTSAKTAEHTDKN